MTDRARKLGFVPPPHINAEPHRKLMELLDSMTAEEKANFMFDLSVRAGIYTPAGELTEPYRDDQETTADEPASQEERSQ